MNTWYYSWWAMKKAYAREKEKLVSKQCQGGTTLVQLGGGSQTVIYEVDAWPNNRKYHLRVNITDNISTFS